MRALLAMLALSTGCLYVDSDGTGGRTYGFKYSCEVTISCTGSGDYRTDYIETTTHSLCTERTSAWAEVYADVCETEIAACDYMAACKVECDRLSEVPICDPE